jgi:hypothetical protein
LRNIYDLFLLSRKEDPLETVIQFAHFPKQFNAYLTLSSKVLGGENDLRFIDNSQSKRFYWWVQFFMEHPRSHRVFLIVRYFVLRFSRYITFSIQAIFNKGERKALVWRLSNWNWYKQHLASYRNIFR